MRNESQVLTVFANLNRFFLAAMILAVAIALVACGNANGDSAKEEQGKGAGRAGRSRGDAAG